MNTQTSRLTRHRLATRDEWLAERTRLLRKEKALTRRGDALARERHALPWVRVDQAYRFDTEAGSASLAELFDGRSQLLVYHMMFGPDYTAPCPSCASIADGFDGFVVHLAHHDVTLAAVSRAPIAKLRACRRRMGWMFPWVSSHASGFNADFGVAIGEEEQRGGGAEYNFRREPGMPLDTRTARGPSARFGSEHPVTQFANMCGTDPLTYIRERPGMSAFVLEDGVVYHTYSTYARGLDALWGMYQWLDRAPLGRNEADGPWWRRHDEYAGAKPAGCCHE
jgi:predicted dithiol-disulfide oxidoreductase (DUF899 family)